METLELFKQAGLQDVITSIKDEWTHGDFLRPATYGAGLGGAGYGAASLFGKGEEGETKGQKTKRVLQQMLKGTALGGLAGGAVGGAMHWLTGDNKPNRGGEQQEGPKALPSESKAAPVEDPKLTGEKASPRTNKEEFGDYSKKLPGEIVKATGSDPAWSIPTTTAAGAGAGAGLGALTGKVTDKFVNNIEKEKMLRNPDWLAGDETRRLTSPDGPLDKAFNTEMTGVKSRIGEQYKAYTDGYTPHPINPNSKPLGLDAWLQQQPNSVRMSMSDVIQHLPKGTHPNTAADVTGWASRIMQNQGAAGHAPYMNMPTDTDLHNTLRGLSPSADPAIVDRMRASLGSPSASELPSVNAANSIEEAASRTRGLRYGRTGGALGALLGLGTSVGSSAVQALGKGKTEGNPSARSLSQPISPPALNPGNWSLGEHGAYGN